jgi:hypothetical protein
VEQQFNHLPEELRGRGLLRKEDAEVDRGQERFDQQIERIEPGPLPRMAGWFAGELHTLLQRAEVPGRTSWLGIPPAALPCGGLRLPIRRTSSGWC